jgi:hypothetical protein
MPYQIVDTGVQNLREPGRNTVEKGGSPFF